MSHAERLLVGSVSRYGDGRRPHVEREPVRETTLGIDVRLADGSQMGFFYFDMDGPVMLDAQHTVLTVPFRTATLKIVGVRLTALYRAVLLHSLDVLEPTHRPEFAVERGDEPVISTIEVIREE